MKSYWSCSKFADWLRGVPKPEVASLEEWDDWNVIAKKNRWRYWLADEGLDYIENIVLAPFTLVRAIRAYISNRWVIKTHALTSTLKRGQWYDLDTRLLEAIFDELVTFVETELALEFVIWTAEDVKKYKISWYRKIFRLGGWRCPEAGVDYLHWASVLKYDEQLMNKNDPKFGKATPQALAAQEILVLYEWWKNKRPNRPDPSEASGWRAYCEVSEQKTTNDQAQTNKDKDEAINCYREMEQQQEDDDTEMLIRLIKIRKHLWT